MSDFQLMRTANREHAELIARAHADALAREVRRAERARRRAERPARPSRRLRVLFWLPHRPGHAARHA